MLIDRVTRRGSIVGGIGLFFSSKIVAATVPNGYVNVRSFGARGDGQVDDTVALMRAHGTNRPVFYPRPARFYRVTRPLDVVADVTGEGSTVAAVQDGSGEKTIFFVQRVPAPITIRGMILDGGYNGGTAGEHSHGLWLKGAANVSITNNVIRNVYGDCVYAGSLDRKMVTENVKITNNLLVNPRRCCIALVAARGVVIDGNTLDKPNDYVAAVDLEPNNDGFQYVEAVTVSRNSFKAKGTFLLAVKDPAINHPMTGVVVDRNVGTARFFFYAVKEAEVTAPTVTGNRFMSNSIRGRMFYWYGVRDAKLIGNRDESVCWGILYGSNEIVDSTVSATDNQFCNVGRDGVSQK